MAAIGSSPDDVIFLIMMLDTTTSTPAALSGFFSSVSPLSLSMMGVRTSRCSPSSCDVVDVTSCCGMADVMLMEHEIEVLVVKGGLMVGGDTCMVTVDPGDIVDL